MNITKKLVIFTLLCSLANISGAQEENASTIQNELWLGYSAQIKLKKGLKLGIETQQRYNDSYEAVKLSFVATSLKYKFNKHFYTKLNFRHTWRPEERSVKRYTLDFLAKEKLKKHKLELAYRARVLYNVADYTGESSADFRNKISVNKKLHKVVVSFVSYEIFYQVSEKQQLDAHRFSAGFKWRLKKDTDLKTFYRFDYELNRRSPEHQSIVGVQLSQSF